MLPVARALWENIAPLCGDYSEVPFDDLIRRPRYAGLRQVLARTMFATVMAAAAAGPPIQGLSDADPPKAH